jgi:hypothetical protein
MKAILGEKKDTADPTGRYVLLLLRAGLGFRGKRSNPVKNDTGVKNTKVPRGISGRSIN